MHTMKQGVSEFKNVCTTKLWANVCGNDVVSNSPIMHVISQGNNVKSIYVQELEGRDHISKNIVIRGIKEESTETPKSIAKVINMHYSMSGVSVYGAH